MAIENLDSMMTRKSPTKSEIVSLGFSLSPMLIKMLSDETAISKIGILLLGGWTNI